MPKSEKPPLGLLPRTLFEERRLRAIEEATVRYLQAQRPIPPEWIIELNYYRQRLFENSTITTPMNMNDLTIKPERVKEAAAACPQAEATLKMLFPEVFKEDELKLFPGLMLTNSREKWCMIGTYDGRWLIGGLNGDLLVLHSDPSRNTAEMLQYIKENGFKPI